MKDLERHILENRMELDEVEAIDTDSIWFGIQKGLNNGLESKSALAEPLKSGWSISIGKYWQWSIAASLIILIAGGIWLWNPQENSDETFLKLADYYPALESEEQHFKQLISQKEAALNFDQINPKDYQEIFRELHILERIRSEYRNDLPQFANEEQLVRTLLRYYEQKIRILERLSKEIEKKKRHESLPKEKHI